MKQPYIVQVIHRNFAGPFAMVRQRRSWGMQWVIVFANLNHSYIASVGFNGNSKQRRQQRRALLRALNDA